MYFQKLSRTTFPSQKAPKKNFNIDNYFVHGIIIMYSYMQIQIGGQIKISVRRCLEVSF